MSATLVKPKAMGAKKITYDEITVEIAALNNVTPEERTELLIFIRDFKQELSQSVIQSCPVHLRHLITASVI